MQRKRLGQVAALAVLAVCALVGARLVAVAGGVPTCENYDHTQCPQPSNPACCELVEDEDDATIACKTFCDAAGQPQSCCSWYRVPWYPVGNCCEGVPTCWDVSQATRTWTKRCVLGGENGACNEQLNNGSCVQI